MRLESNEELSNRKQDDENTFADGEETIDICTDTVVLLALLPTSRNRFSEWIAQGINGKKLV